ncbi:MAG: amino acid permease [Acidobacteriota bacterium]
MTTTASPTALKRQFGLLTAVAMIVGQVIAVGIFLTPAGMARSVGSPFWLLLIWIVIGAMTLSGALCYGELASRFPSAGGSYVYLREAYGPATAFLYGWMNLLVLDPGLTATLAVGLSEYASFLIPLSAGQKLVVAIATILLLGSVNILGARLSANFLKGLTALKVGTLIFIIGYGFLGRFGDASNFTPFISRPDDVFGALAGGVVGAFFAFAGWWEVSRIAGEIKDAERNLPRALIIGTLIITTIYILTSAVFFYLVHPSRVANDQAFAAQAGEIMFGPLGGKIFAAVVVLSVAGSILAYLMASPRVYYAMARDGLFINAIGRLHPRFGTPHLATLIQMALAVILVLSGSFEQIISYFFFVVVFFVAMAVAGLFRLRKQPHVGYTTWLYPLTPIFFLLVTAVVLMLIAARNPLQTILGVAVTLAGLPVYYLIFSRNKSSNGVDKDNRI